MRKPSPAKRTSSSSSSSSSSKHDYSAKEPTSPKPDWLAGRIREISNTGGYQKPEILQQGGRGSSSSSGILKLDSNENYVMPVQFQSDAISAARSRSDVREYPLGGVERLVSAISKAFRMPSSMIAVGNGSDQILDMLLGHLIAGKRPKKMRILASDPTFGFFEDRCRLYGIPTIKVPFSDDMTLDASEILNRADNGSKNSADVIYLDSPNNPTGFQFARRDIERIIREFEGGLVIIDEAYAEFGGYTVSGMTRKYDNLIVVRTLSKSFGLAGIRLGYMMCNPDIARAFSDVIQYPYPLSTITIEAGIEALGRASETKDAARIIKSERARIVSGLREHDAFEVFDSAANFVLFDARGAHRRVHAALAEQGISVRLLGRVGSHQGCLRVTVGTREMNSRFLLAVRDLLR